MGISGTKPPLVFKNSSPLARGRHLTSITQNRKNRAEFCFSSLSELNGWPIVVVCSSLVKISYPLIPFLQFRLEILFQILKQVLQLTMYQLRVLLLLPLGFLGNL